MFISLKANKKRILAFVVLVAIVIGACLLLGNRNKEEAVVYPGGSNEERVTFLTNFGWEVVSEPIEMREVMIPQSFNDVYTTYNEMQKAQGFDLKPYAGYNCMQYKYQVSNYPSEKEIYATILVFDARIIGGDLACADVDGFMRGFAANSVFYGEKASANENAAESQVSSAAEVSSPESSTAENNAAKTDAAPETDAAETDASAQTGEDQANTDVQSTQDVDAVPEADVYPTD